MDALECIKGRRSVREFKDTPVTHEVLESIIDSARFAPSWKNTQISRYVALTGDSKKALADTSFEAWAGNAKIVNGAPVVIVLSPLPKKTVGRITIAVSQPRHFVSQPMKRA